MAFCKHCGNKLEDGAKFCPKCGNPTNGEVDAHKSDGNDKNNEDAKNTKVGCISLIVIMLFIGYIVNKCSGGEDSKATDDANAPKTEQVVTDTPSAEEQAQKQQEEAAKAEAERQAREEAERQAAQEKAQKEAENKKEEVAKAGYDKGYEKGFEGYKYDMQMYESTVKICYSAKYGTPMSEADKELFKIYSDNFWKGYQEGKKN